MGTGMIMRCLGLSACIVLASNTAYAAKPEAKRFQYVTDGVNQINYLMASSSSAEDNSKEIVSTACNMLTKLVSDDEFATIIKKVGAKGLTEEQKKVLLELGSINDTVDKERQTLQDLGIDQLSSIQAMAAAIPLAKSIDPAKYNSDLLLKDVNALKEKSCSLTGEIAASEKWAKEKKAVVLGISGVAFVVADGAAEYYSWGLAHLIVAFSFSVGGGMVSNALHDLSTP